MTRTQLFLLFSTAWESVLKIQNKSCNLFAKWQQIIRFIFKCIWRYSSTQRYGLRDPMKMVMSICRNKWNKCVVLSVLKQVLTRVFLSINLHGFSFSSIKHSADERTSLPSVWVLLLIIWRKKPNFLGLYSWVKLQHFYYCLLEMG